MLEKKKDYKLRAKDFNDKQRSLQLLRKKALNKNSDEFYFHMVNSKLEDGVHKERSKEKTLSEEQKMLMQTQDMNYIISKRTTEKRKLDKLQSNLHLINSSDKPMNKHMIFVDSEKEKRNLDLAKHMETHPSLLGRKHNRTRLSSLKKEGCAVVSPDQLALAKKETLKSYKELKQRLRREEHLSVLQRKMEMRAQMRDGKKKPARIVREETKSSAPVYLWANERKR